MLFNSYTAMKFYTNNFIKYIYKKIIAGYCY